MRIVTAGCLGLLMAVVPLTVRAEMIPGVGPLGEMTKIASGFQFTEGPADDGHGNLYFTDIPNNTIHRLSADRRVEVFTSESRRSNGLMFASKGRLLACEMSGQLVAWDVEKKERQVLADDYKGKPFNAPNDLVIDREGGVYFTDPHFGAANPLPQGGTCVYYWTEAKGLRRVTDNLPAPNGVMLSPDEKTLYVFPSGSSTMLAYPIQSPGELGEKREFYSLRPGGNGADGATIDSKGNIYITSHLGVEVVAPNGKHLGIIECPEKPANVTFGGTDLKTLYITARTSLYAAPMQVAGHRFGKWEHKETTTDGRDD
jgi:gluconolactonase